MTRQLLSILTILTLFTGCEILGPDRDDHEDTGNRTYPQALDLPAGNLGQIRAGTHPVGQFNLTTYVVGISECPPAVLCIIADHIQVNNNPDTDEIPLMIAAEKPSQFTQGKRYRLSIEVFSDGFPESSQSRYVRLLAWSDAP